MNRPVVKKMLGNNLCIKLDPENNVIKTPSGFSLQLDTTFEPDKHVVRVGTVEAIPDYLINNGPWETDIEIQVGDRVVMYYLAVQNCLRPERKHFIKYFDEVWIFLKYHNIYAVIRDGEIIPVNGYLLVEPQEDPEWIRLNKEANEKGIELVDMRQPSKTHVTYGKIAYMGKPNGKYRDAYKSDLHYDLEIGDTIIMKRIRDIPVEYEYHAKLDGGRKLWRMQRHDILAVV